VARANMARALPAAGSANARTGCSFLDLRQRHVERFVQPRQDFLAPHKVAAQQTADPVHAPQSTPHRTRTTPQHARRVHHSCTTGGGGQMSPRGRQPAGEHLGRQFRAMAAYQWKLRSPWCRPLYVLPTSEGNGKTEWRKRPTSSGSIRPRRLRCLQLVARALQSLRGTV
jgi:hypothetical protein